MNFWNSCQKTWQTAVVAIEKAPLQKENLLRFRHFCVFVLVGTPTMTVYGLYNLAHKNIFLFCIISITAISLVTGCIVQLRCDYGKLVYRTCGAIYCFLLLYMFTIGGDGGSKCLWFFTLPMISFFLMGSREGAVWALSLILIAVFLFFIPFPNIPIYRYSNEFIIRLITAYLIISFITCWLEYSRTGFYLQMKEGNKRFEEILQNSRDILYRRDIKTGKYHYISNAFGRQLGYENDHLGSFTYQGVEELIHPEDKAKHDAYLKEILQDASVSSDHEVEYRMRHKDGNYFWFSDKIALVRDDQGKPEFVIGHNREITNLRQTRLALQKANNQLFTVFDSLDAHIYVADMKTCEILFMNNKMKEDFGTDLEGEICWKGFRKGDGPCDHCTNERLLDIHDNPTGLYEWECYNPLLQRWFNNYDRAIQWTDGAWVRLQIAVDITRTKEMEEEKKQHEIALQRARQLETIGRLAGGIAHDFNNLLQIIEGNIALIEEDKMLSRESLRHIANIDTAAGKAHELANRLITFARGGGPLKEPVIITTLIRQVIDQNLANFSKPVVVHETGDIRQTPLDYNQMVIAIKNLLTNAGESLSDGGEIKVFVENFTVTPGFALQKESIPPGNYVRVTIQDTGSGIPQASLPKIFDPYFSTKDLSSQKGVGLGLSIVYSIIKRHSGFISVHSQIGVGTTVHIYLCAEVEDEPRQGTSISAETPCISLTEEKRVLVMDDDEMVLRLITDMMQYLGYEVDTGRNGEEAIEHYTTLIKQQKRYTFVLLDLSVKDGLGGKETIKRLLAIDSNVRAIVSSGYSNDPVMERFADYGFMAAITKPYTMLELQKALQRFNISKTPAQ